MKAVIHTRYGPPEVLSLMDIDTPEPKDKEVLIKVYTSTVNRTDCGFRSAEYFISRFFSGLFKPNNKVLGNEFAGIIEAVGKEVRSFKVGDKVFGYNDKTFGAHAEFMVMPELEAITSLPSNFTLEEATALTEGGHYALCDIRAAKVNAGQEVMVYGASGAIGSAAVQLMKALGAKVTAVCHTRHLDLARSLGAEVVIDYVNEDFTKIAQRFDFIFDAVGKSSFRACKPLLKEKGIYISTELGKNGTNVWQALLTLLWGGKKVLFPIPTINKEDVLFLKNLAEAGKFKPVIDRRYSLEEIVEATKYVESGQKIGNVLITISQDEKEQT